MNTSKSAPAKTKKSAPAESGSYAKIRTLVKGVPARGFTFGKGQIVERVPLAHAKFLQSEGKAEIVEVS